MALDIHVEEFFKLVGHDGGEVLYPQYPDPWRRAGIHPQEAIDAAWQLGKACTPFDRQPQAINFPEEALNPRNVEFPGGTEDRFLRRGVHGVGVIECVTRRSTGHAVAFDHGNIYDPDGSEYVWGELDDRGLQPIRLWRITERCN